MLSKIKRYIRFFGNKPSYHIKGSVYGGLRMDIDKFYSIKKNKDELKKINRDFGKIFNGDSTKKKDPAPIA